ncbi:uncharacterized protein LOC141673994 [Apium graveolens]|uniref:uncharacterized protein LOC141673994 n=1 Tax=Apium graveolens TaxID=4045 RepID=UPI003D7A897A
MTKEAEAGNKEEESTVNSDMAAALKKLQAEMEAMKSENATLKREITTAKSKTKTIGKKHIPSDKNAEEGIHDMQHDDDYDKRNADGERRRSRRRSRSKNYILESVKKELQEVRDMIQRIPGVPKPLEKATSTSYTDSPFTDDIAKIEIPKRFTVPYMKPYDVSSDPLEHIAQYKQRMFTVPITMDLKEPCMCKGFGSMLTGPAIQWFVGFPNGKSYRGFYKGLERGSPLYEELTKYPCSTMKDVQVKAMAQVRLEEDRREDDDKYYRPSHKIATTRSRDYKPYSRNGREEPRVYSTNKRADWRKDPSLPLCMTAGFNIKPSAMMKEFHKLGNVVKWPVKSNKPKLNHDSKLWCDFHGEYGHRAHDCVVLQREIQTLIKKGYLSEFMKHSTHDKRERSPARQPPPPPHHKLINFIAGGSDICGATYSHAKRITWDTNMQVAQADVKVSHIPRVYFDEQDKGTQRETQYDRLVISIPIGNFLIKRVLVDNGSAENIMMLMKLKEIGLAESDMLKRTTTLVGFSGETKRTMREIALPTYAQGVNLL